MHDVETTFTVGRQRGSEREEVDYAPDVPLATRLRLELAHLEHLGH